MLKFINLVAIAIFVILIAILMKYKLVCEVIVGEEKLGYVTNKDQFEQSVNDIINREEDNKLYTVIDEMPKYNLILVGRAEETKDDEILARIEESSETMYKLYAVTVNGKKKVTVSDLDKAEKLVKEINKEYKETINPKVAIVDVMTTSKDKNVSTIKKAKTVITKELDKKVEQKEAEKEEEEVEQVKYASLGGVKLSVKPVSGLITSRFGSRESIRSSGHSGLDIAAPNGTTIRAAASGTVLFSGYSGGYGKVVKISHGNGVLTYYAHCSSLYVKTGQKVSAGDKISAVGSTGNSTGNHLHFEVIKNGVELNPQAYLY